jgi:hypothetical protein
MAALSRHSHIRFIFSLLLQLEPLLQVPQPVQELLPVL